MCHDIRIVAVGFGDTLRSASAIHNVRRYDEDKSNMNVVIDSNVFYEWSGIKGESNSKVIDHYLKSNFKSVSLSIINLYELLHNDKQEEKVRNFIIDKNIQVVLLDDYIIDKNFSETLFSLIFNDKNKYIRFKESLIDLTRKHLILLVKDLLEKISIMTLSCSLLELEKVGSEDTVQIDIANYNFLSFMNREFINEESFKFANDFFHEDNYKRSKNFKNGIEYFLYANYAMAANLFQLNKNKIILVDKLSSSSEIEELMKKVNFGKPTHRDIELTRKLIKNNYQEVNEKYLKGLDNIYKEYILFLIKDFFMTERKLEMNDIIDACLLISINKNYVLTIEKKMIEFLKKMDVKSYEKCIEFKKYLKTHHTA